MKIVIAGSSGLIGTALTHSLVRDGHVVVRLQRPGRGAKKADNHSASSESAPGKSGSENILDVAWNPNTCDLEGEPFGADQQKIEGCEALVNLAGAPISEESWSAERKAILRSSRIHITRELVCSLERLEDGPKTILSASAVGYYGNRGDEVLTEESKPGENFLAKLAHEWEAEAMKGEALGMRVVRLRFGVILAKHGGALPQMSRLFKFGLGGRIGSGQQWMSWIALHDAVNVIREMLQNTTITGAVNVVSPQPVRNADFAKALGHVMRRPSVIPAPAFALQLALGEMADELLLASQRVAPSRLEQLGFRFDHRDLESALDNILHQS